MLDALIIGAGPAGASCALWLARLGLDPMLADARPVAGGLLNDSPYRNDWIVTQPGVTGPDLAEGIGLALAASGVPLMLGHAARTVTRVDGGFAVAFALAEEAVREVTAKYLVIATGVRPRHGGLLASERVLIGPGAHIAAQDYSDKSVAILGGGDNAFENYEAVKAAGATEAHIYARTVRAAQMFSLRVNPHDVRTGPYEADAELVQVNGRPYDLILVMYGWEPKPVFAGELGLTRNDRGFLEVDFATCATSGEGIFAIGEVTSRSHPSVVGAMADGMAAAKAIQRLIEG